MGVQMILFLDSAGASDKNLAVGQAHWILKQPIGSVPNAQVGCSQFSFTNYFVNVSAALGNNKLYYSNDALAVTKWTVTIPDGSYSFNDLNAFLKAELISQGHGTVAGTPVFSLVANYATNKVGIQFSAVDVGFFAHFGADSPFTLMGYTNGQNVPASKANVAYYLEMGPNSAQFNNITNLKVSTNLTNSSISNTNQSPIILTCVPVVAVGSTQTFEAKNILWLSSSALEDKLTEVRVQILDQSDHPVLLSEDFTCTLIIRN